MQKTVVGAFRDQASADQVVRELKHRGVAEKNISVVARHHGKTESGHPGEDGTHNLSSGLTWGGTAGGVAGLLAGVGALAIPGIGPIVAAGPLAATLTGAVAGGIVGGLMDFGIPKAESQRYEERLKAGDVILVVRADADEVSKAENLFRQQGATDIYVH
ncbi:MAG: hypothetical protein M0Z53_03240 [Thermaerobacter sp.]|nr:hypothetical protein [Thermaerobacter sp.]